MTKASRRPSVITGKKIKKRKVKKIMKDYGEILKELERAKARAEKAKTACEQIGDELSAHFDKIRNGGVKKWYF